MPERHELTMGFGPASLAGWSLQLLGILKRSRLVAILGRGVVVADVTVAELGGFTAMNETRPADEALNDARPVVSHRAQRSPCTA